jgi:hypothetical protein
MSTVSSVSNPYVIPHTISDPNPSQTAFNKGVDRNILQNKLVNVSKSIVAGGSGTSSKTKIKKSKKMRMSKRMSRMSSRRRFSRKFRKSLSKFRTSSRKSMLGRRRNKHKNKKFSRGGAGATMTIPSFSQTTPSGTSIINQLASNHAQTLAYSSFDSDVKLPPTTAITATSSK